MSSDNQYTALGPAEIGFQTNSNSIDVGAEIAGNSVGLIATGFSDGVLGTTTNGGGAAAGVHGRNTSSGNGYGVLGEAGLGGPDVSVGIGVRGVAGVGVYGEAVDPNSPSGLPFPQVGDGGVIGDGQTIGVRGRSGPGTGVFGTGLIGLRGGVSLEPTTALDGTMPTQVGVWGTSIIPSRLADSGEGVLGEGVNGVHGRSRSSTDSGVWGENINGGFGVSGSTNAGDGPRGTVAGVWGSNSGAGAGVRGTGGVTGVLGEGSIGVHGISNTTGPLVPGIGVQAEQTAGGIGLLASSTGDGGVAVSANAPQGIGVYAAGGVAPLRLVPAATPGIPTSGIHGVGELYVDSAGALYFCVGAGEPGNWKTVQLI